MPHDFPFFTAKGPDLREISNYPGKMWQALVASSALFLRAPMRSTRVNMALPAWVPAERAADIAEPTAQAAFASMETVELTLPEAVASGPCAVRYLKTSVSPGADPPLILVHGFDISSLEYRRLLPQLEAAGIEAYAPCIPGWGFTETSNLRTVGVEGKREALLAFHQTVVGGRPAVWVGASLGACIALDCYQSQPSAFTALAFLAPGFFTPPPPVVPAVVGRLLLQNVLSSPSVRESIAKQAYCVKEAQTEDAIRVGNLHLNRAAWEEDSLEWLLSGAYGDQSAMASESGCLESAPTLRTRPTTHPYATPPPIVTARGRRDNSAAEMPSMSLPSIAPTHPFAPHAPHRHWPVQVPRLAALKTLTLWGRQDEVIPPVGFGTWPYQQRASNPNALTRVGLGWVGVGWGGLDLA